MAVGYVQVGFAALWGILFFGDRLQARTIAGMALVVSGALAANAGRIPASVHPERTRAVQ